MRAVSSSLAGCLVTGCLLAGCIQTERPATVPKLYAPDPRERLGTDAPPEIAPPSGQRVAFVFVAEGVQNYECRARDGGFGWTFTGPEARLYNGDDKLVGKHYAGPTWEYLEGGKVKGVAVAHVGSHNPNSVDQLLLRVDPQSGTGVFAQVSYIQRLRTNGGAPPADACTADGVGHKSAVEYSAEYVFFTPT
jgi:hypothetical protein